MEQSGSGAQRGLSASARRQKKAHLQLLHGTKFSEDVQMENRILPGPPSPGKHPGQMSSVLARQPPGSHRKTQAASPETDVSVPTSSELLTVPSLPTEGQATRTNISGVFAVGDVRTKALRQVVTAVADGATAAHYAEEYLATL